MNDRNRSGYDIYLIVRSVTLGQRGRGELERGGVLSRLQRSYGSMSEKGCAYALRIRQGDLSRAEQILRRARIEPEAIYRELPDGTFERIWP